MRDLDKFKGCIVGGSVGDALGYAVEFQSIYEIQERYGYGGITKFELENSIAKISDDTQMLLFTAAGLLTGTTNLIVDNMMSSYIEFLRDAYLDWYKTQTESYPLEGEVHSWLLNERDLFYQRSPGRTCLSALSKGGQGTIQNPINNSKGCGGVMRVAPIGLYFSGKDINVEEVVMLGAKSAALTHGHILGYISAGFLTNMIFLLSQNNNMTILESVKSSMNTIEKLFPSTHQKRLNSLIEKAISLSNQNIKDIDAISILGEGWVAEETLAIAIYSSLKYENDFEKAIIASVNHSGDSDSTGSVTGNIMGTHLGFNKIPNKYLENLDLLDVQIEIATDLYNDVQLNEDTTINREWKEKYVDTTYKTKEQ